MNYRYQVNFEKVFTAGTLKGRRYPCEYLRFTDWHSADVFAKACDGKTEINPCDGTDWLSAKGRGLKGANHGKSSQAIQNWKR